MKHLFYLISIFFFLNFVETQAQSDKHFLLRTNLSYSFTHDDAEDLTTTNNYQMLQGKNINNLQLGFNAARKFKSNFYCGLGLSYNLLKTEYNPDIELPEIDGSVGFVKYISYAHIISRESTISPFLYVQYYKKLYNKLYIAFDFYSKYSFYTQFTYGEIITPDTNSQKYIIIGDLMTRKIKRQFLTFCIYPSFRFEINKNLGMELIFGKVEYLQKTGSSAEGNSKNKTKKFEIGFKPENWLLGFYIRL